LIDAWGRVIETKSVRVTENSVYTIHFTAAGSLAKGVYFIEYIGAQRKTIKVVK
jgi:hypothetical protein